MKKQIQLALLGMSLFAGAALNADETTPSTKFQDAKLFLSKQATFCKEVACNRYFQAGSAAALTVAVGVACYYAYKAFIVEKTEKTELV